VDFCEISPKKMNFYLSLLAPVLGQLTLSKLLWQAFAPLMEPSLAVPTVIMLVLMLFLSLEGRRPKLAFARWAGKGEKLAALNLTIEQLRQRKHDKICLYLGTPKYRIHLDPIPKSIPLKQQLRLRWKNFSIATHARIQTGLLNNPPAVLLPSAERGIVVCGSPGSGKTFSFNDPIIRCCIDEKLTLFIYDVKGDLMRNHAAYAAEAGYAVYVFAPGFPYSGCINLLDFMRDEADATMAREIAHVINQNAKRGNKGQSDDFFGPAADQLVQTVLMLAKGSMYPDLLMAFKILSLPNLAKRLLVASNQYRLDLWAEVSATQVISVAEAERTVSGIVGAAINTFSNLVNRDFIPAIAGQTTIPLDVRGKTIVFFQTDEERESISAPLQATNIAMMLKRNLNVTVHSPQSKMSQLYPCRVWLKDGSIR
jgi:type IV secretion system protein VirD4